MRIEQTIEKQRFLQKATYNAWEEDFATLNIFFGQETVMGEYWNGWFFDRTFLQNLKFQEMERSISMGPVEFVSSLGGLFGLFLGFSIISFLEIIYWATVQLARNVISRYLTRTG